jgi:hypothetical protein
MGQRTAEPMEMAWIWSMERTGLRQAYCGREPTDLARKRAHGFGAGDGTQGAELLRILAGGSAGVADARSANTRSNLHPQIPLGAQDGTKYWNEVCSLEVSISLSTRGFCLSFVFEPVARAHC